MSDLTNHDSGPDSMTDGRQDESCRDADRLQNDRQQPGDEKRGTDAHRLQAAVRLVVAVNVALLPWQRGVNDRLTRVVIACARLLLLLLQLSW